MDYVIGSVAALITGNVTPNRPKLSRKPLTPTKHQPSPNVTPKSEFVEDRSIFLSPTQQKKKAIVKKSPKRIFQNPDLDTTEDSNGDSSLTSPKTEKVKKHLIDDLEALDVGKNKISTQSPLKKSDKSSDDIISPKKKAKVVETHDNVKTPKKKKKKRNSESNVSENDNTNEEHAETPASAEKNVKKAKTEKQRRKPVTDITDNQVDLEALNTSKSPNKQNKSKPSPTTSGEDKTEAQGLENKNKKNKKRKKNNKKGNLTEPKDQVKIENKENKMDQNTTAAQTDIQSPKKKKKNRSNKNKQTKQITDNKKKDKEQEVEKMEVEEQKDESESDSEEVKSKNLPNPNAITEKDSDSEHDSDDEIESDKNEKDNSDILKNENDDQNQSSDEEEENPKNKKNEKKSDEKEGKETIATEEEIKRTLFVGNVPFSNKCKKEIKKIFSKYGQIETIRIRTIPVKDARVTPKLAVIRNELHPDRTTVNVYIKYADAVSVTKALAENNSVLNNNHLRVTRSGTTGAEHDPRCAVFVGNLPFAVEDDTLRSRFEKCGEIESVRIIRDKKTNAGKGFGYVNFSSKDAVELALALTEEDLTIKNRIVRVKRCTQAQSQGKRPGGKPGGGGKWGEQGRQGKDEGAARRIMYKRKQQDGGGDGPPNKKQKNITQPGKEKKPRKEFVGMTAEKKKKHKFNKGLKQKKVLSEILTKKA